MDRHTIINGLKRISQLKATLPTNDRRLISEAVEMLEKNAHIMSLPDLIEAYNEGWAVWLEVLRADVNIFIVTTVSDICIPDDRDLLDSIGFSSGHRQILNLMGVQWRCWNERPTAQQRMTPWEGLRDGTDR